MSPAHTASAMEVSMMISLRGERSTDGCRRWATRKGAGLLFLGVLAVTGIAHADDPPPAPGGNDPVLGALTPQEWADRVFAWEDANARAMGNALGPQCLGTLPVVRSN